MARDLAEVLSFGRYEPLFRIGLGGMAEVYAARIRGEAGFQKLVAIKRMLPHLTTDQKFVDMFLDEARLAVSVQSPHVVSTLDLGRSEDGSLYLVMELIIGVTLGQLLIHQSEKQEFIDYVLALEVIAQAAQGLDDAHAARAPSGKSLALVHRDVSPQNILIGIDGRVRVTDFGIAQALHLRRTQTQVGEMKGKFSYFSPEQAAGGNIDGRSDVFSLGICAWEIVTGRRLFKGKMLDAIDAVKTREIAAPHTIRPEIPPRVSAVLMKALERDRDRRYLTAGEFAAAIRRSIVEVGDPPSTRKLGQLVVDVGGDRLDRIHECIARADGTVNTSTGVALVSSTSTAKVVDLQAEAAALHDHATHIVGPMQTEMLSSAGGIAERPTRPSGRFATPELSITSDTDSGHDPPTVMLVPVREGTTDTPEDPAFAHVALHDAPTINHRSTDPDVSLDDDTVLDDRYLRGSEERSDSRTLSDRGAVAKLRRAGLVPPTASDRTVLLGAVALGVALVVSFGVGIALALSSGPAAGSPPEEPGLEPVNETKGIVLPLEQRPSERAVEPSNPAPEPIAPEPVIEVAPEPAPEETDAVVPAEPAESEQTIRAEDESPAPEARSNERRVRRERNNEPRPVVEGAMASPRFPMW
jgi:serine/threonine protein kinase